MATLYRRYRNRNKPSGGQEEFVARTVMDRLETEGFKPLIKTDVLEKRLKKMEQTLDSVSTKLLGAWTPDAKAEAEEEAAKAIDEAHNLVFYISSAWLRSMENPWLAHKVNRYISQYNELRSMSAFFDTLLAESKAIINIAHTNIDVEPLRPIIIQTTPQKRGYWPDWQEDIRPPAPMPPEMPEASEKRE